MLQGSTLYSKGELAFLIEPRVEPGSHRTQVHRGAFHPGRDGGLVEASLFDDLRYEFIPPQRHDVNSLAERPQLFDEPGRDFD